MFNIGLYEEFLQNNPYCKELQRIGCVIRTVNTGAEAKEMQAQINAETNRFEVGVLISHDNPGCLEYTYKLNGETIKIPTNSSQLEPLVYPMLFPHGEKGWSKDSNIKYLPYLACRMLMPEKDSESESGFLECWNKAGTKLLKTNRFQLLSRVSQHFIVEGVSRLVDSHLSFVKANNGFILEHNNESVKANREIDVSREVMNESCKSYLNDSITGSPRHLKALAKNALHIVSEKGKPHCFLTITANPNWPEIQERLFPGQTAYDRYFSCNVL
jgi:hypothetical protein